MLRFPAAKGRGARGRRARAGMRRGAARCGRGQARTSVGPESTWRRVWGRARGLYHVRCAARVSERPARAPPKRRDERADVAFRALRGSGVPRCSAFRARHRARLGPGPSVLVSPPSFRLSAALPGSFIAATPGRGRRVAVPRVPACVAGVRYGYTKLTAAPGPSSGDARVRLPPSACTWMPQVAALRSGRLRATEPRQHDER